MQENYLSSIKKQFTYYKMLGDKTFEQLDEGDFFWQYNPESNSIAITAHHIAGNMKSRWTDFLTTDGEKEWRNRDLEFEDHIKTKDELLNTWNEGWDCLFAAIDIINKANFNQEIFIRNQSHSIVEAINRQLAHYSYHIGQIVFLGRMIKGEHWVSLSLPKGNSVVYNKIKFAKGKHKGHFTDDLITNLKKSKSKEDQKSN